MERCKFTPEFKRQVIEQAIAAGNNTVPVRQYKAGSSPRIVNWTSTNAHLKQLLGECQASEKMTGLSFCENVREGA